MGHIHCAETDGLDKLPATKFPNLRKKLQKGKIQSKQIKKK